MIDTILAAVPVYGLWIVTGATFLSCLALPIPSSLIMMTAGAFVAAGDLPLAATAGLAWLGAVLGDQLGYRLGRGSGRLIARLTGRGKGAELVARATALSAVMLLLLLRLLLVLRLLRLRLPSLLLCLLLAQWRTSAWHGGRRM